MTVRRVQRVAVLVAATSLLLSGCGGDRVDPDDWASHVCGAWQQLHTRLQEASTKLQADMADQQQADKAIVSYLSSLERGVRRMQTELENTGVPDVENGEQARSQILDAVSATRQALTRARTSAQTRNMSDPTEAMKVFADLSEDTKQMLEARHKVSSPELREAFEQVPACKKLRA